MTTARERTKNLLQAGAFLIELRTDESLPERIRYEANRLLRHYPTAGEIQTLALMEARSMGSNLLTLQFVHIPGTLDQSVRNLLSTLFGTS